MVGLIVLCNIVFLILLIFIDFQLLKFKESMFRYCVVSLHNFYHFSSRHLADDGSLGVNGSRR